ncbi:MAG: polysaccharide deacetylase family protein, partial [Sedimentisphaerales bacterium]|nr:polysaccharide deacetylase family protein [Sedimentisphaerales bacterium]
MDEQDNPLWIPLRPQLPRDKLEQYLKTLSRRYHFVSLMDAVEMICGRKPMQPYSMVLTFDDGYRNNLTHALPILRRYNVPATFFVTTSFLDNPRPFWWDRLDYALQQLNVHRREVKVGSFTMTLDSSTRKALCQSYKRLRRTAKNLTWISDHEFLKDIEQLSCYLEQESGRALADIQDEDDWSAIMTWKQVQKAANNGVTIGSHTVDHIRLGLVEAEITRDQLERSKRDIEEHISKPCLSICYPNGSLADETVSLARECGYICGLTTKEGLNCVGDDVMRLQRIGLPVNARSIDLLARISGVSMVVSRAGQGHRKLYGNLGQWKLNMFHHCKRLKNIFFYHISNLFKNKKNNIPNVHKYENYDISKYLETAEKLKINIMPLGFGIYELTKGEITRRISSSLCIDKENALTYKLCGNKYLTYKIL